MTAKTCEELLAENREMRWRLEEAEDTLQAIRSGGVDALVVSRPEGDQIFTLQGAEYPYRALIEAMNDGAAILDPRGTILYCNSRFADLLQIPLERVIGSRMSAHVPQGGGTAYLDALQPHGGAETGRVEISIMTGAGKEVPILISSFEIDLPATTGLGIVITDISSQKQAEKKILLLNRLHAVSSAISHALVQIRGKEELFREFCRVAVEVGSFKLAWVGVVGEETGAVEVAAASGETGYLEGVRITVNFEPEGMGPIGTALREGTLVIFNDFFGDEATLPWQDRARAFGLASCACVAIRQEKEVVAALTLYSAEKDAFDDRHTELLVQMGNDISFALDRIFLEERVREAELQARVAGALRELNAALERRVAERTAELAQSMDRLREESAERIRVVEELRKKEQLLIHQSRLAAMGEMIGNIAHQWRQPLNILGLLLQQFPYICRFSDEDRTRVQNHVERSMNLVHHMSQTIDDFRNFFRPEKQKALFSMKKEVRKTVSLVEQNFMVNGIKIAAEFDDDPKVLGYPNEFSQVLLNILVNAKDAFLERKPPQPCVLLRVFSVGDRGVVTITDNAGGIPEDIIHKIFDPYFTTKTPEVGTGVGLFMAKSIIERSMGGRLTVRNAERGAEFGIELSLFSADHCPT